MIRIKITDYVFEIDNYDNYLTTLCKDFISDEKADMFIKLSIDEIEKENNKGIYDFGYCESLATYRRICEFLCEQQVTLIHGAFFKINDIGILFTGKSGSGKTTQLNLWKVSSNQNIEVINGDKPLFKFNHNSIVGFGSPWSGKEMQYTNTAHDLHAIILIKKANDFQLRKLNVKDSINVLMSQIYFPKKRKTNVRALESLKRVIADIPIFEYQAPLSGEGKNEEIKQILNKIGEHYENKK